MNIDIRIIAFITGTIITTGILIVSILNLRKTNSIILDQNIIKESLKTERKLIRSLIYETMTQEEYDLLKEKGKLEKDKLYMIQNKSSTK